MRRILVLAFLCLVPLSVAFAQEPEPVPKDVPQVKGEPVPEGRVRLVRETGAHTGKPIATVFTPDGKKLVSVGEDRTLQLWDVASRERLGLFHLSMGVDGNGGVVEVGQTLVVDRQGKRVAFCVQGRDDKYKSRDRWFTGGYTYWEKTTGNNWSTHNLNGPFAFVEVRRTDDWIELFDKTRKHTVTLYKDHNTVQVDGSETRFLSNGGWGKAVTFVLTLQTGQVQVLERFGPRDFSPDGKLLAIAEGSVVRLVNIDTDTPLLPAADLGRVVVKLVYSPDGKTLAASTHDGKFHLLDAATLKLRKTVSVAGAIAVRHVTWADDHTVLCSCRPRGKTIVVVDADTGTAKHTYAFADLWKELPKGYDHDLEAEAIAGTTQAFIRHHHKTPGGAWPHGGFLFDWSTGKASEMFSQGSWIASRAAAIAPDMSVAAQGHGDWNEIVLWDPKSGKVLLDGKVPHRLRTKNQGAEGGYGGIRWFTSDAVTWTQLPTHSHQELDLANLTLRSVSREELKKSNQRMADLIRGDAPPNKEWQGRQMYERGIMQQWDKLSLFNNKGTYEIVGGTAEPLKILEGRNPITWDATFVAGGRIVFSSFNNPVLQVFDSATAKRLHAVRVANSDVRSMTISPDRRFVAAGSLDQTIAICNPVTGKLVLTIFPAGTDWIAWTPEGHYAGTPGGERLMGWHVDNGPDKLATFYPAERFRKRFYRPDVIKLVLKTGSVEAALKAADAALGRETRDVKFDDVLPPSVQLTLVEQNKSSLKLRVRAEAQSAKQPISSMRLFLDGRPVQGKETFAEFSAGTQKAEIDWTFELPEGEHQLTVLVRGPDSSSVSPPLRLKHAALKKLPTLHVLTIGINDYQDNSLDLKFAAPDATALAAAFSKHCKGQAFAEVKTRTLLNKDATAKAILRELADMRKDTMQEDLAVVFFACHGVKQKEGYFLLTHEANLASLGDSSLSGDALRKSLGEFKCQVLLMLDACHSAGFGAGKKLANLGLKPATDDVARDLTEDDVGIAVMCAAMSHEKAEGVDGHGLFTKALLEALEAKPDVPRNRRNQRVYVHHLQSYVFDEVSDRSQDRQHPFLSLPWVVESFVVR